MQSLEIIENNLFYENQLNNLNKLYLIADTT